MDLSRSFAVVMADSESSGGHMLDEGGGRIRRSDLCANKRNWAGVDKDCRLEILANALRIGGICLRIDAQLCLRSLSQIQWAHSATATAFLTKATMSTTKMTAEASLIYFVTSSFNLGCPGKSTKRICFERPSSSVKAKEVIDGVVEVCVCGYTSCVSCCMSDRCPFTECAGILTLANRAVFPPSDGPTSRTVAGPVRREAELLGRRTKREDQLFHFNTNPQM